MLGLLDLVVKHPSTKLGTYLRMPILDWVNPAVNLAHLRLEDAPDAHKPTPRAFEISTRWEEPKKQEAGSLRLGWAGGIEPWRRGKGGVTGVVAKNGA